MFQHPILNINILCRCYNREGYRPLACLSFFIFFFPTCLVEGGRGLPLGIEDVSLELSLADVDASLKLFRVAILLSTHLTKPVMRCWFSSMECGS